MVDNRDKRKDFKKNKHKYTALISVSSVALLFIGLGVFLDGEVLPKGSDAERLIKQTEKKAITEIKQQIPTSSQSDSSEYIGQLSHAIDLARQTEQIGVSELERRVSVTKASINEINQLANLDSDLNEDELDNDRLDEFNQNLNKLQNQLSELEATH
jgi:hypothetical protein